MDQSNSILFLGQEHEVILPSGKKVTFREPNGDDEEILSRGSTVSNGDNVINYLTSIVTMDHALGKKPYASDILEWKSNDKYYLLLMQRIEVNTDLLVFKHDCQSEKCKDLPEFEVHQELKDFLLPIKGVATKKYAALPYPNKELPVVNFMTSSKKSVRYKVLDGVLEKSLLAVPKDAISKNTSLSIRQLEIDLNGTWTLVTHYGVFSTKDLSEIRKSLKHNDPEFDPNVEFNCPTCGTPYIVPLFAIPAFYYPEEGI